LVWRLGKVRLEVGFETATGLEVFCFSSPYHVCVTITGRLDFLALSLILLCLLGALSLRQLLCDILPLFFFSYYVSIIKARCAQPLDFFVNFRNGGALLRCKEGCILLRCMQDAVQGNKFPTASDNEYLGLYLPLRNTWSRLPFH